MRAAFLGTTGIVFAALAIGCGGSSFDLPEGELDADQGDSASDSSGADTLGTDTLGTDTSGTDTIGTDTTPPPTDTAPEAWTDTGCVAPGPDATDVYVDGSTATTGKGSSGCPFKTILEATTLALNPSVTRTIHVKSGSYNETDVLRLKGNMRLVGEFGVVNLTGGSVAACTPSSEKCDVQMDSGAVIDNFAIDAKNNGNGIVGGGTTVSGGAPFVVKNTSVKNAQKDGVQTFSSGDLGPNVHIDENGYSGVAARGGTLHVIAGTNSFDKNKGTAFIAGGYAPRGGIVIYGYGVIDFEGGTANENKMHGIVFDGGSNSTTEQKITGLIAQNNGGGGLSVNHSQGAVTLRKSTLTKNVSYGAWFSYNTAINNKFDFGTVASPGGNVFGGASEKNGKVGIFLCGSGLTASQAGEGNKWAACAPTQGSVPNCDSWPSSYVDVGYRTAASISPVTLGANPLAIPTGCTVGP